MDQSLYFTADTVHVYFNSSEVDGRQWSIGIPGGPEFEVGRIALYEVIAETVLANPITKDLPKAFLVLRSVKVRIDIDQNRAVIENAFPSKD